MFLLLVVPGIFFDHLSSIADQSRRVSKLPCRNILIRFAEQLEEIQITQIGKHFGGRLKRIRLTISSADLRFLRDSRTVINLDVQSHRSVRYEAPDPSWICR